MQADRRLAEIKEKVEKVRKVFIVTGSVRGGKTTFVQRLIEFLKRDNINVGGILSERVMDGSMTIGYDLLNIETGERTDFLRHNGKCGEGTIGRFTICLRGLEEGKKILSSGFQQKNNIVVIDEVGLLEIQDKGWSACIDDLLEKSFNHILITVRDSFVDKVKNKWDLEEADIIDISETNHHDAVLSILESINSELSV